MVKQLVQKTRFPEAKVDIILNLTGNFQNKLFSTVVDITIQLS